MFLALLLASNGLRFFKVPFFVSAWAYSFPLAALTTATLRMATLIDSRSLGMLGILLLSATSLLIALLAARTLRATTNGELLRPD